MSENGKEYRPPEITGVESASGVIPENELDQVNGAHSGTPPNDRLPTCYYGSNATNCSTGMVPFPD